MSTMSSDKSQLGSDSRRGDQEPIDNNKQRMEEEEREPSWLGPPENYGETEVSDETKRWIAQRNKSNTGPNPFESKEHLPTASVSGVGFTQSHLDEYNITQAEGKFMRAVVKAMNRDLRGYTLTESMREIREMYEPIHEKKLLVYDYLKKHTGASRRVYYSVTFEGQEACKTSKEHGPLIGDMAAETPHRVGIELARRFYRNKDTIRRTEICKRENGHQTDMNVIDTNAERVATVEVEGGQVTADAGVDDDARPGTHNFKSVRKDYQILADAPGESVWVVRNYEIAGTVLRALCSGPEPQLQLSRDTVKSVEDTTMKMETLNKRLESLNAPGIDTILTFKQLRNRL